LYACTDHICLSCSSSSWNAAPVAPVDPVAPVASVGTVPGLPASTGGSGGSAAGSGVGSNNDKRLVTKTLDHFGFKAGAPIDPLANRWSARINELVDISENLRKLQPKRRGRPLGSNKAAASSALDSQDTEGNPSIDLTGNVNYCSSVGYVF